MPIFKTTALIAGGTLLSGALLLGIGPLSSYIRTSARVAGENVAQAVPAGFEIERIQTLVGDLDQVIAEQQAKLVDQQVDLEYLQREVERAAERMDGLEAEVGAARNVLSVERASYRIGDRHHDRATVVREAKAKAEALVRAREIHAAKAQTLAALERALGQAEGQLAEARNQRETYAMRLAELRAKAENVAIRQELVVSLDQLPDAIDDGAFNRVEQAFQRVERELEVQDRLLEEHYRGLPASGEIDFAEPADEDVVAFLDQALGGTGDQQVPELLPTADGTIASDANEAGTPAASTQDDAGIVITDEPIAFSR